MEKICIVGNEVYAKFTHVIPKAEYNIKPGYSKEHSLISDHNGETVSVISPSMYGVYFDGYTLIIDGYFTRQRIKVHMPFILSIDGVEYKISMIANTANDWINLNGLLIDLCRFSINRPIYSKDTIEEKSKFNKHSNDHYTSDWKDLKKILKTLDNLRYRNNIIEECKPKSKKEKEG